MTTSAAKQMGGAAPLDLEVRRARTAVHTAAAALAALAQDPSVPLSAVSDAARAVSTAVGHLAAVARLASR